MKHNLTGSISRYSAPILTVYGHVSKLTASGTGPHPENAGSDDGNNAMRQRP